MSPLNRVNQSGTAVSHNELVGPGGPGGARRTNNLSEVFNHSVNINSTLPSETDKALHATPPRRIPLNFNPWSAFPCINGGLLTSLIYRDPGAFMTDPSGSIFGRSEYTPYQNQDIPITNPSGSIFSNTLGGNASYAPPSIFGKTQYVPPSIFD